MTDASPTAPAPKSFFPLAGGATDGFSTSEYASATCFCGAVQLKFALTPPGLVDTFLCHCSDCRKLTSSTTGMHNLTVLSSPPHLIYIRGRDNLSTFTIDTTTSTGASMTNHFCATCGTLMMRTGSGFEGMAILRGGTVDDFTLVEGVLKPRLEEFVEYRIGWMGEIGGQGDGVKGRGEGVRQVEGFAYEKPKVGYVSAVGKDWHLA